MRLRVYMVMIMIDSRCLVDTNILEEATFVLKKKKKVSPAWENYMDIWYEGRAQGRG
jgi:hypothetical protein